MQNQETLHRLTECQQWIISKYGEDVFQETCVRYYECIRKDPLWHAGLGAIKKIARSVFIDAHRRQSTATKWLERKRGEAKASRRFFPDCLQDEQFSIEERNEIIDSAIQRMRPDYATVIIKQFFNGLTIQEIADESCLSKNTVRSWRTRALEQLKTALQGSNYFSNN